MNEQQPTDAGESRDRFGEVHRDRYREFQATEGIPVYTGFHIESLMTLELKPWARMGGLGAYVNLFGEEVLGDNYLLEIPPDKSLEPQRHMFEEAVYVLSGRGATTFWARPGGKKWTFEWNENSLFALQANMGYQHFNGDNSRPARLFAKTTLPAMFQYFTDPKFIFENDFVMEQIESDIYSAEAKQYRGGRVWSANFVPDVRAFDRMQTIGGRGAGGSSIRFYMPALARLNLHQSEFPVATYKKAHAHPPGRAIILVKGDSGYSLLWQPGYEKERKKVDWHTGSVFGVGLNELQGEVWWHQHFNTGTEPARYLVQHVNSPLIWDKHVQIEYVDEDPEIRKLFESELAKSGIKSKMPPECYTDPNYQWERAV
ncbi:hypothetical protein ACFL0M_14745 [Thermodesulfobacteriota bacterium]